MGYSVIPYAVPLTKLRAAIGSKDVKLVQRVSKACSERVLSLDESFADEIARGAPTAARALRELVDGTPRAKGKQAAIYVYALELVCSVLGARLSTSALESPSSDALALLDKVLQAQGVTAFRVENLITGPAPVKLPPTPPLSNVATIERAAITRGLSELKRLDVPALEIPTRDRSLAEGVRDALTEVSEWFAEAHARRGNGLVTFYY